MRNIGSRNSFKDWARLAAKLGILLTEPKVRAAIGDQLKDRMDSVADAVATKYEDAAERLEAAGAALYGRNYWPGRVMGFLVGVGVGAGLGILLAPAAGAETREAIRGKTVDLKERLVETASNVSGKFRQSSVTGMPSTGTEG